MFRISTQMISERAVTAMLNQQNKVANTQLQLSTGRRVLTAADDPTSAARVLDLSGAVETVRQYLNNADRAQARLDTEEGVLVGVTNLLQRTNELAVQGNNDTLTQSDRIAVAAEVRQLQDELFSLANTRGSNGEYIFAGYQSNTRPFSFDAGSYSYDGDLGNRKLQISADRQIADGNNGYEVFMDVPRGPIATVVSTAVLAPVPPATTWDTPINAGEITIDGGNGSGTISLGAIPAAASAEERAQQIRDAINAVSTETGVTAVNDTTTTVELTAIGGNGITIGLSGAADTTTTGLTAGTTPPTTARQSMFDTLNQLATELENGNSVDRYIADVQLALENIFTIHTSVGARLNAIDEQNEVNRDIELVLETHLSEEQDLDYTEAISRFERQMVALQAAQQAYVKVQGLSLFNYL